MTIEQLEAFVAAVRSDSFSLTDANSKHVDFKPDEIETLEEEFGTPLVAADGNLTEAGEALFEEAIPLIRQYRVALKRMDTFRRRDTRPIVIGTLPIMDQYRLTRVIERYQDEYPEAQVILETAQGKALISGLQENYYDAIILPDRMINTMNVTKIPMASDEMAAIVSPNHPLAEETGIPVKALASQSFCFIDPSMISFGRGPQILKDHHISTDQALISDPAHVFEAVRNENRVTILPISALKRHQQEDLIPVPFKPRQGVNIVFAYRKDVFPTQNMENLLSLLNLRAKPLPI